jgi:hypothetical protein
VEITMFFGSVRRAPLHHLDSRLGNIHNMETREQIPVRGLRFRGAERFHRALRARQGKATANC